MRAVRQRRLTFLEAAEALRPIAAKLMPASGGKPRELFTVQEGKSYSWGVGFSWTPDGRHVIVGRPHVDDEPATCYGTRQTETGGYPGRFVPSPRTLRIRPHGGIIVVPKQASPKPKYRVRGSHPGASGHSLRATSIRLSGAPTSVGDLLRLFFVLRRRCRRSAGLDAPKLGLLTHSGPRSARGSSDGSAIVSQVRPSSGHVVVLLLGLSGF